ncbi:iron-containing alcohol dehydrogenase [Brumimicrobium aurantiacum]|uniref:Iron-containing alcohol dehydrogenase n=1 Tax=Brumimicrobium aurantiacum TaxID=1737063 RepID=A0A3E1EXI1_9FLAO|nr:iron-containing alcohol dehydrogenase [Brumimicrobium aurantiacum]RFC54261.1 iron-containing alcohol dehydrogenase [Brumimicrobium aurantiacum]
MNNFEYYNPTRVVFGTDTYAQISNKIEQITAGKRVMVTYGGGSIKKNGVYDAVMDSLKDFDVVEFSGIEANPEYDTLMKAVEMLKKNPVDFVIAIGGGSVIDGTKFIVSAAKYDGNPWDVLSGKKGCKFEYAIPFGSVLTLPATGSEMNSGAVISNSRLKEKRTMGGPQGFPKFSFLDPTVVKTLPKKQIANGIVDAYMHTLEQYLTYPTDNLLQERIAEGILSTLIEIGPKVLEDPSDYKAASNLMWCATMALNGTLRAGVAYDWSTHMIGHELTALHGIDHARTLAIVMPSLYKVKFENKQEKLIQYGQRIFGLEGSCGEEAINRTRTFFESLGIQTKLSDYTDDYKETAGTIRKRFEERGWEGLGERKDLTPAEAEKIVQMSI